MKFVHTFFRWNAHVQMKAPTPLPMKQVDDRDEVLVREALQRAGPEARPGRRTNSK